MRLREVPFMTVPSFRQFAELEKVDARAHEVGAFLSGVPYPRLERGRFR
jgi:hypothetical protein